MYSQKEAANWFFGEFAGLDFNSGVPIGQTGMLETREGCASISDRKGNLLFYTDGSTVFDRNHNVMPNGTELLGNNSSTQSAIIVPKPESKSIYYIFTVDSAELSDASEINHGLNYTIIDMNLNNGYGDVVDSSKNKHLITYNVNDEEQVKWKCSEKVTAVLHEDEKSYWVVTHFIDTFYAFRVDETGVVEEPVKTKTSEVIIPIEFVELGSQISNISALGYIKISPDGKKLAIAHSSTLDSKLSGKVFLYDFNNVTGVVSQSSKLLLQNTYAYGLEFSPKSKKVYITSNKFVPIRDKDRPGDDPVFKFESSSLYQFNMESPNIESSKVIIDQSLSLLAGALQLGIDGKIYRAKYNILEKTGMPNLAAINKPDLDGENCDYENDAVNLDSGTSSRYGLPPFVASIFKFTFDYEFTCIGDATHFFVPNEDSYDALWDFGDGTTSTEQEPYYSFSSPGEYSVKLTITIDGVEEKPIIKKVQIIDDVDVMQEIYELIECDSNDENSSDGIATFNLQLANDPISLGNENSVEVFYYNDLTSLNDDLNNSEALPNFYINSTPDEIVYAKVVQSDSDCFGIGKVLLRAIETQEFAPLSLLGCYQSDDMAQFDLSPRNDIILTDLNLDETASISYHLTKNDASLGYEPLEEDYISESEIIYIRVEKEGICYGVGELNLEVSSPPNIDLNQELNICESEFPLKINSGISPVEIQNYTFEWENGQVFEEIEISQAGVYHVIISDKLGLCNQIKTINVNLIERPEIRDIEIQEDVSSSYTATIKVKNADRFLYGLNNDFGINRNDPTFRNLAPGTYTAYVADKFNCNIIEKQFYIFGFPKFFTPNNDGQNDVWAIKGLNDEEYTLSNVNIYNRYGKHLVTINANSSWNGTYNGKYLPPDDYWFSVIITNKENISKVHKGHFSLLDR